jgi:hypothetical protein
MQKYFDAQEYDRCRMFKERFLGCPALTLTGAEITDDGRVIAVVDAAGNRGSMPYDSERKRDGILAEIERGRRAELMVREWYPNGRAARDGVPPLLPESNR